MYPKNQSCPHCSMPVEDNNAEWEEGSHEIECDSCEKIYIVEPVYTFEGFRLLKVCHACGETEIYCCCEMEEK
jgi:hypothetical protein